MIVMKWAKSETITMTRCTNLGNKRRKKKKKKKERKRRVCRAITAIMIVMKWAKSETITITGCTNFGGIKDECGNTNREDNEVNEMVKTGESSRKHTYFGAEASMTMTITAIMTAMKWAKSDK